MGVCESVSERVIWCGVGTKSRRTGFGEFKRGMALLEWVPSRRVSVLVSSETLTKYSGIG
jgi:hypothetical protein